MTDDACPLCTEPVAAGPMPSATCNGRPAHNECSLRSVLGGIGHLEDHAYWCGQVGDPDGGRTYRQSALEVAAWVQEHGLDAAVDLAAV